MSYYEYMVLPAPREAPRLRGVKGTEARFARGMGDLLNHHGRDGWEYQRTETMTAEARTGLLGRRSVENVTVLVFRRWIETAAGSGWHDHPEAGDTRPGLAEPEPVPYMQDRPGALSAARGVTPDIALRPVPGPGRG